MRPILCGGGKEEGERYCPSPRNKGGSDDNDGWVQGEAAEPCWAAGAHKKR